METLIIIITLALIVILGTGTSLVLNQAQKKKRKNRVLSVIRGQAQQANTGNEKESLDKRRADIARKLKESSALAGKAKKKSDLRDKLTQAGMATSVRKFWLMSFLFAVLMTFLLVVTQQKPVVIILGSFVAMFGIPRFFLKQKIKRRQKKFLEDFADALEAMVRLLKAGMPVAEAIAMASREFSGPIGEEMLRIYDSQKIGMSLPDAVLEASQRMPLTEMQMFSTGITIQAQTGSSLSEVLTNLARVIRARFRLRRKVQALSAEAKASAMIIGALPVLVGGGMYLINKEYMLLLIHNPVGVAWLIGSVVWMSIGVFVMRAMINFKI